MFDNAYVRVTNNFLHDMATGTWAACLLVLWVLSGKAATMPPESAAALVEAMRAVFWMLLAALAILAVTGGLRLAYWRKTTPANELAPKRKALLVKHLAFAIVYGGGTYFAWTLLT